MMQKVRCRTAIRRLHSASTACRCTVSGSISLPSSGFFSPFPHGTSSLSVSGEYLVLGDGPPGFPQDFKCPVVLRNALTAIVDFAYGSITLCAPAFQLCSTINYGPLYTRPTTPEEPKLFRFGLFPFRSHYWGNL